MLNRTFILVAVLWMLTISASAHAQLVAHYPFDAGFDDISGLENHGNAEGGPLLVSDVPPGFSGQSLELEDGQYVLVPHNESLDMQKR